MPTPEKTVKSPSLPTLEIRGLCAGYGATDVIQNIDLAMPPRSITAIIGPSGCGKSTLIRCLNRMHELQPGATRRGRILLEGEDIDGLDAVQLRRHIGMVFQRPNPFPNMSIFENVAAGLLLNGRRYGVAEKVEASLKKAALWDEVMNRLDHSTARLSGGQQQRLCIARALAVEPRVLLLDEPCSALDPISTAKVEELLVELKEKYAIVIVTHNMQQAARISDFTGFMLLGDLVEFGPTSSIFTNPRDARTQDYITGRFG